MLIGLTITFLLSQFFAGIAIISDIISFQYKDRQKILIFFIISATCIAAHYFLLDRFLAGALLCIGIIRFIVSYYSTWKNWKYIFILIFTLSTFLFYKDIYDIILYIAFVLITIGVFEKDDKKLRLFLMSGTSCVILYNFFIFTPIGVILESIFLGSNLVGYYRHYFKGKNNISIRKQTFIKFSKNIYVIVGFISSVSAIIGVYFLFFPKNDIDYINKIYPNILIDYNGASFEKIRHDFGLPFSSEKNVEGFERLTYKMDNGTMIFGGGIEIYNESIKTLKINLPGLYNESGNDNLILGKDTLDTICDKYNVNKITSSWGTLSNTKYTEVEYYSGNIGQYRNYVFGTYFVTGESFEIGEGYKYIEENTEILDKCNEYKGVKLNYLKIQ